MGWTMGWRDKGQSNREFFARELLGVNQRILAAKTVSAEAGAWAEYGRVFYAAVEESKRVWGMVVLITGTPGTNIYGWKAMEENQGPAEDTCPAEVLDLLTPTDSENANEWRERCRRRLAVPA